MTKRFDEILNECIRQLETSGGDIEATLSRCPEHADELRPHLEVWASLSAVEKAQATRQGAMRGRQRLLSAIVRAEQGEQRGVSLVGNVASKGGLSMRFLAVFVTGAALALGITLLTGNLDFGSDSEPAQAGHLPACVATLDFSGDDALTVDDVLLFKNAIATQNPAFDYNFDGVVDIHDAVAVIRGVIDCFRQQQPPPLP